MTFDELIASTSWAEVKAALLWLFPDEEKRLSDYRRVFWELRRIKPKPDPMRIAIERRTIPGFDETQAPEVIGRNGTLNRELDDFKQLGEHATAEYGAEETVWSLSLQAWSSWLGMTIEPATLTEYSPAQAVAYCLSDMTFHGFSEAENREVSEELERRVAEIDAMSEEERAEKLIPAEKVFSDLKEKYGVKD
jgi:hypothetical protein